MISGLPLPVFDTSCCNISLLFQSFFLFLFNVPQGDGSCAGKCDQAYDPGLQCQCNAECGQHNNCCPDFDTECGTGGGGSLSDADLMELSEMLIR